MQRRPDLGKRLSQFKYIDSFILENEIKSES